jgi:hypothetical protein
MPDLITTARKLLLAHKNDPAKAMKEFVHTLLARRELLDALAFDYLSRLAQGAPKPKHGSRRVRAHKVRPHRRRTKHEHAAAVAAELTAANAIFNTRRIGGRPIGDLRWGELRSLVAEQALDAASYLRQGTEATTDAILLKKMFDHAEVDDQSLRVREVIGAKDLARLDREAQLEAPRIIERGMHDYADRLTKYQPEELPNAS